MAQAVGISRSAYINLEIGAVDHCSRKVADRLAAFYGIGIETLLDDYNLFLYRGQGSEILKLRQQVRMGKKPFARSLGVSDSSLRDWEAERKRVSRKSWERYFKEFTDGY